MVGGFIEQDQVEIIDEEFCEIDSAALSTRERMKITIKKFIAVATKETGENFSNPAIARPLVDGDVTEYYFANTRSRCSRI